jgi:hypothetical protein
MKTLTDQWAQTNDAVIMALKRYTTDYDTCHALATFKVIILMPRHIQNLQILRIKDPSSKGTLASRHIIVFRSRSFGSLFKLNLTV